MSQDNPACEYCGLLMHQPDNVTEDGEFNDNGWWCRNCIRKGYRRTLSQVEWAIFAEDYPKFALELKRLRKIRDMFDIWKDDDL